MNGMTGSCSTVVELQTLLRIIMAEAATPELVHEYVERIVVMLPARN